MNEEENGISMARERTDERIRNPFAPREQLRELSHLPVVSVPGDDIHRLSDIEIEY